MQVPTAKTAASPHVGPRSLGGKPMSLMSLIVTLIVVGILLWAVNNYLPLDGKIKKILNVVVVIAVVVWLLSAFNVFGQVASVRIPRVR